MPKQRSIPNPPAHPGRPATLKDIAERCGVSHVTVSRALRHDRRKVSATTYEQIWAVARELQYDPDQPTPARRLAMQRNNQPMMNQAVALFCPRYLDMGPYFGAIVDGIMEEVEAVNFALLTVFPGKIPPIISRGDIDGALVLMPGDQQHLVEDLRLDPGFHGRAVVSIIRELPTESNVLGDDEQGGYLVVRHLLDLGHRTLLFGHYQSPTHERRLQGGHRACREAGVDPTCVLYPFEWDSNKLQESEALLDSLLRTHPKVTGIFAPNDMAAVEIADYCRRRGIAIPDAMSLVGFDDIVSLPDAQGQNRLTTVHLDLRAVGHEAARLLVDLVRGDTTAPRTVILPVRLVIRDTTAPPRPC